MLHSEQKLLVTLRCHGWGGAPIYENLEVCATAKGMVFRQFNLEWDIEIRQYRIINSPRKWPVYK